MDQQIALLKPHIRTMKKDIKRLRELDALKETKKIIETISKPQHPKPEPKEVVQKVQSQTTVASSLEKAEQYATEEEKQKIFLLKSNKADAENQLAQLQKEVDMLALQKAKLEAEQKTWQDKLAPITVEEQKWPIEKKIADASSSLAKLNQNIEALNQKSSLAKGKISQAEAQLKELYGSALKRNLDKKREEPPQEKPATLQQTKPASQPSLKEKVQAMDKRDQDHRKKFLEDIEAWANSH